MLTFMKETTSKQPAPYGKEKRMQSLLWNYRAELSYLLRPLLNAASVK
jgi:hypothetical protein